MNKKERSELLSEKPMEGIKIERSDLLFEKPLEGIKKNAPNFYPRNQWKE